MAVYNKQINAQQFIVKLNKDGKVSESDASKYAAFGITVKKSAEDVFGLVSVKGVANVIHNGDYFTIDNGVVSEIHHQHGFEAEHTAVKEAPAQKGKDAEKAAS